MEEAAIYDPPIRVTDLIMLKQRGAAVTCRTDFEIVPVDFQHGQNPFRAHIFLCLYSGMVNDAPYSFRKCYARGCPNNLCPHVSQAVMIANRYLQRDYHRMIGAGLEIEKRLFTLDDMMVKFNGYHEQYGPPLALEDYVNIALEGHTVIARAFLEFMPVVEHFANSQNQQIFLMARFEIDCLGHVGRCERCLACYPPEASQTEKDKMTAMANERLRLLYDNFDRADVRCNRQFF